MNGGLTTVNARRFSLTDRKQAFFRIGVCLISLPALVLAGIGLFAVVGPLHGRLLTREARALADQIDSVIKERNAVLEVVMGNMPRDNPPKANDLEALVRGLRSAVPDFLSLEVLDGQGAIVAMLGDLDLPEAGRHIQAEKTLQKSFQDQPHRNLFKDDPAGGFFTISGRHRRGDGTTWFTRARFSREPIDRAITSAGAMSQGKLIPVSGRSSTWPADPVAGARIQRDWWGMPQAAEAMLLAPNWTVRLERSPASWVLLCFGIVVAATMTYSLVASTWLTRMHGAGHRDSDMPAREAAEPVEARHAKPPVQARISPPKARTEAPTRPFEEQGPLSDTPEWLDVAWSEPVGRDVSRQRPVKASTDYSGFSSA
jgi:hypothetical protein